MNRFPSMPLSLAELSLAGKTAVVTGAAAGIGRAIAQQLAAFGALVIIFDKDLVGANETLACIEAAGGKGSVVEVDMRDEAGLIAGIRASAEAHGRLDILVNNAGVYPRALIEDLSDETWDLVFDVNVRAAFVTMREAGRLMREGGAIINISSIDSLRPSAAGLAHYGATKAALNALTRSAASELGPRGIRVNAVLPGVIATNLGPPNDPIYQTWTNRAPARRVGVGFDIAGVVLFLASPLAQYVYGQTIAADGGITATA